MPTINQWRGDADAVSQVDLIEVANVQAGDAFTLTINGKNLTVTAVANDQDVYQSMIDAIGGSDEEPEFQELTAAAVYADDDTAEETIIGVRVTGPSGGVPFTMTVSSVDVGELTVTITETVPGVAAMNEKQTITLDPLVTGGTFTLTFDGQTTAAIAYNAAAATLQTALEALSNIAPGDVTVTGNAGGPWTVEFKQAFASTNVPLMTTNGSGLTLTGAYSIEVTTTRQGAAGVNEVQIINIGNPTSGTYTLSFDGQTTGAIAYNASAATIQTALEALSNIAPGDVTVTALSPSNGVRFSVEFKATYRNTNVPTITGNGASLDGWATVQVETVTEGVAGGSAQIHFDAGGAPYVEMYGDDFGAGNDDYNVTVYSASEIESSTGGRIKHLYSVGNTWFLELAGSWANRKVYTTEVDADTNDGIYLRFLPSGGAAATLTIDRQGVAAGSETSEVQRVSTLYGPTGGTFTLTLQGQTTGAIAYNAAATAVQSALEGLSTIGAGNVAVTGSAGGPWTVTFQGALAGTDVAAITAAATGLTGNAINVATSQAATAYTNEAQQVAIVGSPAGGTFTVSWNGVTTGAIAYNASAATVQAALIAAFGGTFSVTGNAGGPWLVEFTGSWLGANQTQMSGDGALLSGATPDVAVTQEAVEPVNEQQTVMLEGGPAGGTFTLTYAGQTTVGIAYNASAAIVQNALIGLSNIGPLDVGVTGAAGGPWVVTFRESLGGTDVALMTGNGTNLSPSAGTQTITITSEVTPTGPLWFDEPDNWSLGHVPVTGEHVVFANSDRSCRYGLNNPTITPAKLICESTYTGEVGLPPDNGEYVEYRQQRLRLGNAADGITMLVEIGRGDKNGSARIRLDTGDCPIVLEGMQTAEPADGYPVAFDWVGTAATNKLRLYRGYYGIGSFPNDVATFGELMIGFLNDRDNDVVVEIGTQVTQGAVTKHGGELRTQSAIVTTFDQTAGIASIEGDDALGITGNLAIRGGEFFVQCGGTIGGTHRVSGTGSIDFSRDFRTKVVTNPIDIFGDEAEVKDPFKVVASLVLDFNETTRHAHIGTHYRITRAAVA